MTNIGIRLHDLQGSGLEGKLQEARRLGFGCVHLALSKVIDDFDMDSAALLLTKQYADEIKGILEKYQMKVAVLGCYLNLATPDLVALKKTVEIYKAHLNFGKWIGAGVVGTETGAPNLQYKTSSDCFTEETLQLLITRLRAVVIEAEKANMPFALEPVSKHIVSTSRRAKTVLNEVNSPLCRIILDPVNLLNEENKKQQEKIFVEALELLGDWVDVVHWKDYIRKDGVLYAVAAGDGLMKTDTVIAWLKQRSWIPIILENTTPETVNKARDHIVEALNVQSD